MLLQTTAIKFPEIQLRTRDAHKLRGYFGNLFKEKSELLHNHYADGTARYKYPLVQYKVIDKIPVLLGVGEGAKLLIELFLKIEEIDIEGKNYPINSKNISGHESRLDDFSRLYEYRFSTLWMALNQKNYSIYKELDSKNKQDELLNKQLTNNILSFYKGVGYRVNEQIMAKANVQEKTTQFKNKSMLAFAGSFVSNAPLPNYVGIGKSVSRGFGSVVEI